MVFNIIMNMKNKINKKRKKRSNNSAIYHAIGVLILRYIM